VRRRLFLQIYLTLLGVIVLFGVLASLGWWLVDDDSPAAEFRQGLGALVAEALPPPGSAPADHFDLGELPHPFSPQCMTPPPSTTRLLPVTSSLSLPSSNAEAPTWPARSFPQASQARM